MRKHYISCQFFHEAGLTDNICCGSCHDDVYDFGFELIHLEPPGKLGPIRYKPESKIVAEICCTVYNTHGCGAGFTRDEFAKVLRVYRKWLKE